MAFSPFILERISAMNMKKNWMQEDVGGCMLWPPQEHRMQAALWKSRRTREDAGDWMGSI